MMSPNKRYKKPAPTLALMSLTLTVKSVGTPFNLGSVDRLKCVLARHTASLSYPLLVYSANLRSASSLYVTSLAPYTFCAMVSTFSLKGTSSSYRRVNFNVLALMASSTDWANSTAPSPPFSQCCDTTAENAPASMDLVFTMLISLALSLVMWLMHTTTGRLKLLVTFLMWCCRLAHPLVMSAMSSCSYSLGSPLPTTTSGPPPCILSARMVHTTTTQSGTWPLTLHLMSNAFSRPQSLPNPASVKT